MKFLFLATALLFSLSAHAYTYTAEQLREDCQVADELFSHPKNDDAASTIKSTRCQSYVAGFADGYAVSDYLAMKVGVNLNAFCLPKDPDLLMRMVRAVANHVKHVSPNSTLGTANLVAGALAKSFPCSESLESNK